MIKSIKEPVLTLTIHLTSPMIRMEAEPEGAGATTPLEEPPGGMTPPQGKASNLARRLGLPSTTTAVFRAQRCGTSQIEI